MSNKGETVKENGLVGLEDLFIRPSLDDGSVEVSFTGSADFDGGEYAIYADGKVAADGKLPAGNEGSRVVFEVELPNCRAWSVDDPFLYELRLKGKDSERRQTFGMTKIKVEDKVLYFNNVPLYVRGHIRGREAHDHPNFLGVSDNEYYAKNIRMSKEFGFNFIRFHSQVPSEAFLEEADRLGILCQVEIRPYYGHYQKERQMTGFDGDQQLVNEDDWRKMIYRLRNHPSVLIYGMGNEINAPGRNERVKLISRLTKELDDTRLFLDSCSRGEYDRDTVDIDVQHMSYFAPYGKHRGMFDDSIHLALYGSVTGKPMATVDDEDQPQQRTRREIDVRLPLLAHEVVHYNLLRDPYELREKFGKYDVEEPWWVGELIKMIEAKGHKGQFKQMLKASTHYYYIWLKQCLEMVRKSPLLQGFHMLQLADTNRYENANGLLDCFDDVKGIEPEQVRAFNSATVVVADLPKFVWRAGQDVTIPIHVSHYSDVDYDGATLEWTLESKSGGSVALKGRIEQLDLAQRGNRQICRVELKLPDLEQAQQLVFKCRLITEDGTEATENQWNLWMYPDRPERLANVTAQMATDDLRWWRRYPWLGREQADSKLMIAERMTDEVFTHLQAGGDVLLSWRTKENRDKRAAKEKYYWPSTWERFKGVIWDRGHNCGGMLRQHPVLERFPNDAVVDWQLYSLIEDSEKICLDDFPAAVEPIIEGVDKAVRDRYDVGRFDLSEFQYAYTMRKFAYLFELRVGKGRLMVAGMNFKGIEEDEPVSCWMFENIVEYMQSGAFEPRATIEVGALRDYLAAKGKGPRVKERMMTQYWQLDDAPLESKKYWEESEQWLRQDD
ncbi:MAG: hypothetical protein JW936_01430 [Sedimentisphaerales bacterium]|nr:hypothetical protein [Sedimentisphaerales bacterium]